MENVSQNLKKQTGNSGVQEAGFEQITVVTGMEGGLGGTAPREWSHLWMECAGFSSFTLCK